MGERSGGYSDGVVVSIRFGFVGFGGDGGDADFALQLGDRVCQAVAELLIRLVQGLLEA